MFKYIGLEKNQRGGLVPYYFDDVNNVCPAHFNDVQTFGNIWQDGADDLYRLNQGLPADAQIPVKYVETICNLVFKLKVHKVYIVLTHLFCSLKLSAN